MGAERVLSVLYRPDAPRPVDLDLPTVSLHYEHDFLGAIALASSWQNTLWPLGREALFAKLAEQASVFRDSQGTYWMGDVEPAFDPDAPSGPMFCLFIAAALGARHPNSARAAQDALIAAIEDGRMGQKGLGEALEQVLSSGTVTLVRWVRGLRETARVSPLHRLVLRGALSKALGAQEPLTLPLLELLNEWCAEDGAPVMDERLRERLAAARSGKSGRLARDLLARVPAPDVSRPAAQRALVGRLERAERWVRLFGSTLPTGQAT
jgi:hypothetical protein